MKLKLLSLLIIVVYGMIFFSIGEILGYGRIYLLTDSIKKSENLKTQDSIVELLSKCEKIKGKMFISTSTLPEFNLEILCMNNGIKPYENYVYEMDY